MYLWLSNRAYARWNDEWHWQNSDAKYNDWAIPPPDEEISLPAVWIAEAFLPSSIDALMGGLEHLRWWDADRRHASIRESISEGRSGRRGGWDNLPMLRARSAANGPLGSRPHDLPAGVKVVTGQLHYLTPSLTILLTEFHFDDSVSDEANRVLRERYRTFHKPSASGGFEVMDPVFQRRDAIRAVQRTHINECRRWLAERVPGFFATGGTGSKAPATLLVTTKQAVPFERQPPHKTIEPGDLWMQTAGLEVALERWETTMPGLRYAIRSRDDGLPVLAGRESDIFAGLGSRTEPEGPTIWVLLSQIHVVLSKLLAFLATDSIFWEERRRLALLRDSLAVTATSSPQRQLIAVRDQVGTMSVDLSSLTDEVSGWEANPRWALYDVPEITLINDRPAGTTTLPKPLREMLLDNTIANGREARDFEASTRSLLVATAEVAGALENIKLQRRIIWLTILILLVGSFAALGVAHDLGLIGSFAPSPTPAP